jgi:hypothetical protein
MTEIMCRFPVIEGFITVLNRRIDRSKYVGAEEDVESTYWFHSEGRCRSVGMGQFKSRIATDWDSYFFFGRGAEDGKGPRAAGGFAPGGGISERFISTEV